jgi:hypothetical protein
VYVAGIAILIIHLHLLFDVARKWISNWRNAYKLTLNLHKWIEELQSRVQGVVFVSISLPAHYYSQILTWRKSTQYKKMLMKKHQSTRHWENQLRHNCGIRDFRIMNMQCLKLVQRPQYNLFRLGLQNDHLHAFVSPKCKLLFRHHGFGCKVNILGRVLLRLATLVLNLRVKNHG